MAQHRAPDVALDVERRALHHVVVTDLTLEELLRRTCVAALGAVPAARRATVTTADDESPATVSVAVDETVGHDITVPLEVHGTTVGTLTLGTDAVDEADRQGARAFAERVAFVLANHRACARARRVADELFQSLSARAVIEQATGILISTRGCTPDEARHELRRRATLGEAAVGEVAAELVAGVQRPGRSR